MMGYSHMLAGMIVGAVYAQSVGADSTQTAVSLVAGALAAILPDIDHPKAEIRQRMGIMSITLFWLKHRGITHTLLALAIVALAAWRLLPGYAVPIALGYASHLLTDMMTRSGVPLLLPLHKKMLHILPKPLRLRTNGTVERLLAMAMSAALLWLGYAAFGDVGDLLSMAGRWVQFR